ncbi:WD40 repeat domain-containing serine/threonine protein kinase [Fimbriiglobus ruber]|uniref:non-specific serine/threonine protein kinase n=1 Tax=Fimbriiglobus ruber TaxID=1908690 RepID=A0A225EG08_9BACT|nr:serine/threonine-protein kinase [Fimbriiglobus ruber]OWK47177.1 Serine/threonine protein kinase PrkC, regulator of stationary phase [Fimbriiglobus ruber]
MAAHTASRTECPSTEALAVLVHGSSPDIDQDPLAEHVGECVGCQSQIAALATQGDPVLSDVVRHIDRSEPASDSAFWRALKKAEVAVTQLYPDSDEQRSADLKLDFLQPTDMPGHIGRLGTFEVVAVIGRGGMGVVLRAFDPHLSRDVAIKILDPQWANNSTARQRFCREARAAAAVTHDNLVAVHQVTEDEKSGLPYLVMQLINGESLEQRLRRIGKLSPTESARVGMQAAAGLAAAHANGLIHRDIKPGNILIEAATGKVKVTDFGLARAAEDLKLTRTGFVAGTPLYMAPEQAHGEDIDARADLFSLGSVLFESLTGHPPFDGKTPLAVLRRVADEPHARLRQLNPEVPAWLEEIIDKLLSKSPDDRIQTAIEVSERLAQHLSHTDIHAPLEVPPEACLLGLMKRSSRPGAKVRKRFCAKTAAIVGVVFAVGMISGGVGVWEFAPRATESPVTAATPDFLLPLSPVKVDEGPEPKWRLQALNGSIWSVALSRDGKMAAIGSENGRVGLWDVSKERLLYVFHTDKNEQLPAHKGPVWAAEFTADGTQLITAGDDGAIKTWDVVNGKKLKDFPVGSPIRSAAISKSGNYVAIGDRIGQVRVFDMAHEEMVLEYEQDSTVNGVAFSADELSMASVSTDGTVVLRQIAGDRPRQWSVKAAHSGPVYGVSFSPDGDRLATASWDQTVIIWDTGNGTVLRKIAAHEDGVWVAQFAPCGRMVATAGQDGKTKVWDADTGALLETFTRNKGTVHCVRFGKVGTENAFVTGGRDGIARVWETKGCRKEGVTHAEERK